MTALTRPVFPALQLRARMSEAEFQAWVTGLAELRKWRVYHTYDSRRSPGGFPDLVLVRGGRLIFAELKRQNGRLTGEQGEWLADLGLIAGEPLTIFGGGEAPRAVGVYVWRPSAMEEIEEVLR